MSNPYSAEAKEARRQEADGMTLEELREKADGLVARVHTLAEQLQILEGERRAAEHDWEAQNTRQRYHYLEKAEADIEARREEYDAASYEASEWAGHLKRRSVARLRQRTK